VAHVPRAAGVLALLMLGVGPGPVRAQPVPQYQSLRIIAPAAPGGGWDQTGRVMQQVLQRAGIVRTVPVENVPGAAGTIGLARFIGAERGRGDVVMVSGLIMLSAIVTHASPVTLREVTPIARLTGEYEVVVVPAPSPLRSLADLVEAFRMHPESISWGGGSAGGSDQILAGLIADAVGVAPRRVNYIAFSGGGEAMSAILGGQVSVGVSGLAEVAADRRGHHPRPRHFERSASARPERPDARRTGGCRRVRELAIDRRPAGHQPSRTAGPRTSD